MAVATRARGSAGLGVVGAWVLALACPATASADTSATKDACLSSYEGAQRLRIDKQLVEARRQLITCSKSECPEVLRRDCTKWLGEVDAALPSVVVVAWSRGSDVTDVQVSVDGDVLADSLDGTALTVNPGQHVLRFVRKGEPPVEKSLLIREGEKNRRIEVELDGGSEPAPSEPSRLPVYGLAALGAVGIGSFVFFGLSSHSKKRDLEDCKGQCAQDDVDEVQREQLIADVSLGVGLVALGAAAYLHFGSKPKSARDTGAWRLGVTPLSRGAAARFSRSF